MNLSGKGVRYETVAIDDEDYVGNSQQNSPSSSASGSFQATTVAIPQRRQSHTDDLENDYNDFEDYHPSADDDDDVDEDEYDNYSNEKRRLKFGNDKQATEDGYLPPPKLTRCNRIVLAVCSLLMVVWVGFALVLGAARLSSLANKPMQDMRPKFSYDDMFNATFTPKYQSLEWMAYGNDGVYSRVDTNGDIILTNVDGSEPTVFLPAANVTDKDGNKIPFFDFQVSADERFVLLATDRRKQWRHSYNATYYIYDLEAFTLSPLLAEPVEQPDVSFVSWSPVGHNLAYVQNNNLFILQGDATTGHRQQITFDGAPNIFNGITDWVYEEEVLGSTQGLWWSPDGSSIAFLRSDETLVPEYYISLYMDNQLDAPAYPREVMMKYPKAGFPNPIVNLHLYTLAAGFVPSQAHPLIAVDLNHVFAPEDRIIAEVQWATLTSAELLVKVQNRVQNHEKVMLVNPRTNNAKLLREWDAGKEDGGWIDMQQNYRYIAPSKFVPGGGYLDIANNEGFNHIALYTPVDNPTPRWLTAGEWEVVSVSAVDEEAGKVFFISTEKSSLERHLYNVALDTAIRTPMTDVTNSGYYTASFSTGAGYYLLSYRGPDVPWQKVLNTKDPKFVTELEQNFALREALKTVQTPTRKWSTVNLHGQDCNAMEFFPPGFDETQENYPVLFQVYGGPGSQIVDMQFQLGFSSVMSSMDHLQYLVVVVDGRGTGYKGRAFRIGVTNQLGKLETEDQVAAGAHWATLSYVDPNRIAIWGWSYGGYMAAKVVEANSGVFKAAMSVAPVTDWRFYDSVYTERYMGSPVDNRVGYDTSAVANMTGFANTEFLLVHGTGDDNVHAQNALVLMDRLTLAANHHYRSQFFTDSDHAIRNHNANKEIYYLLAQNLFTTMGGYEPPEEHHH